MKQIIKNALILTAITLVSGLCLGYVYELTKAPIAAAQEDKKNRAFSEVLPEADTFETLEVDAAKAESALADAGITACTIDEAALGTAGGEEKGYIITVTDSEGYGGAVTFTVGIGSDGTIRGISFLSISESPGLGMEAKDDPTWKEQFFGKDVEKYSVIKGDTSSDEEISALSGATITSKAVTAGVNGALAYYRAELGGGQ